MHKPMKKRTYQQFRSKVQYVSKVWRRIIHNLIKKRRNPQSWKATWPKSKRCLLRQTHLQVYQTFTEYIWSKLFKLCCSLGHFLRYLLSILLPRWLTYHLQMIQLKHRYYCLIWMKHSFTVLRTIKMLMLIMWSQFIFQMERWWMQGWILGHLRLKHCKLRMRTFK